MCEVRSMATSSSQAGPTGRPPIPGKGKGKPDDSPKKPFHIRLACPCFGCRVQVSFFYCIKLLRDACTEAGILLSVDLIGNESLVQRARNIHVARFLQSDADKLFFVDSDITFTAQDFLRIAQSPREVVAGAYAQEGHPVGGGGQQGAAGGSGAGAVHGAELQRERGARHQGGVGRDFPGAGRGHRLHVPVAPRRAAAVRQVPRRAAV